MIIWGWGGRVKDNGPVAPFLCSNCNNLRIFHWVHTNKNFKLYFVPIVPYDSKELLLCPTCQYGMQVSREHLPQVAAMQAYTEAFESGACSQEEYFDRAQEFWSLVLGVSLSANTDGPDMQDDPRDQATPAPPQLTSSTTDAVQAPHTTTAMKTCPDCAEEVLALARKCRYCDYWFERPAQ